MVSVVLPIYEERESLASLVDRIAQVLHETPHEIVAVDDGSQDGSRAALAELARGRERLRVLALDRHRGQSAALLAGFAAARGDVVVTMDADGQNDPQDIPALLALLAQDRRVSAAVGYRTGRADSRWKRLQSGVANRVRDWITGDRVRDTGCSLRAIRREALTSLPRFDGMHRFLPTLIRQQGGVVVEIPVRHHGRRYGRSKYGMWNRVFRGLRDAFGVRWLGRRALHHSVQEDDPDGAA